METKNGKELETEAMEMFHSLIPETQGMVASHIRMAYMVEQAIRKVYGLPEKPPVGREATGVREGGNEDRRLERTTVGCRGG